LRITLNLEEAAHPAYPQFEVAGYVEQARYFAANE
jgi:hypothetical protein